MQSKTVLLLLVAAILMTAAGLGDKGDKKQETDLRLGMHRVSLSIESARVQGRWVQPGCFVDIAYQSETDKKRILKMIAENVKVTAVDQTCNLYGGASPPVFDLKVTAELAQVLKSQKGGTFALTVRRDNFNAKGEFIR